MLGNMVARKRERDVTRQIHKTMLGTKVAESKLLELGSILMRWPANVVIDILVPLFIAYSLQDLVNKNFSQVQTNALIIIGLGILYGLLWGVGGILVCRAGVLDGENIQKLVFKNYLSKDYEFFSDSYLGSLGEQATRLREAMNEYNQAYLLYAPRLLIIIIFSIAVIGLHSWLLAMITLGCMCLVLSFTLLTSRWRLKYRQILSESSSRLAGLIGDALAHGDTVKSYAREEYEFKQLEKAIKPWKRAQYRSWLSSIPADMGRTFLAAFTVAILLLVTMRLYRTGQIDIAVVTLVQLYVIKMINATHDISQLIKDYESTMGSVYQSVKTMMVPNSIVDSTTPKQLGKADTFDIAFKNTTYNYGLKGTVRKAVNNFSLEIKNGERVGLVGYSGSGKTTLTKLLMRFMDTEQGKITVNGVNIRELKQTELRNLIAYVPQEPLLFHRSVKDNIRYGKPNAKLANIQKVTKAAYVNEFTSKLPKGLDTLVGERGVKLSGGQRQRVAIARALLKDAPILVLDEATSALDSKSEKYIQEALWKLMKGRTALVIAHRLSTIQKLDRIVVMDKGKIVQVGTHQELLKQKGIYAELWAHQSGGYLGGSEAVGQPA